MDKYKKLGLKLTPQRLAILKYLEGNTSHPSAEDVYHEVKKQFPMTSFATVYNTLNILKEKGEILELSIDEERKRFDPNPEPHHHLICMRCKSIVDVHKKYALDVAEDDKQGFEIVGSHIEFFGLCAKCRADSNRVSD